MNDYNKRDTGSQSKQVATNGEKKGWRGKMR